MSESDPGRLGPALLDSVPGPAALDLATTQALLLRARAGDRGATGEIFDRYEERIRRIVRVRLGPDLRRFTESGDLVQETCRALLQGLERMEIGSEFDLLDWLSRVATNRIRDFADHVHAEKRGVERQQGLDSEGLRADGSGFQPMDPRSTPSEQVFQAEVRSLLDEVVSSLPETYREAVLLRDYHGADWADVARALGSPTVHAAQQLHQRAWIKVRALAVPRLSGLDPGRPS